MSASNASVAISRLDAIYRNILLSRFFVKGWGDPENMKRIFKFRKIISNRETCYKLVSPYHPVYIEKQVDETDSYRLYEGHFQSPLVDYLSDLIPPESHRAYFQLMLPTWWRHRGGLRPICVHLAGTGDHGFWRRRNFMAKPLISDYGIGSLILENPFYGLRKPKDQSKSQLKNVSDIFIMGGCLILESLALFHWLSDRMKFGPLCIHGISMGGHNASLAATSWPRPIAVVPCLSWTTASFVFTQGVMSGSIPWKILEAQYHSYGDQRREEFQELIHTPEKYMNDDMFDAGRTFAKSFINLNNFLSEMNISKILANRVKIGGGNGNGNSKMANQNGNANNALATQRDAWLFMRGIMDECTHLGNFSRLADPELAIIINAKHDGYVPSNGVMPLTQVWPGSQVRYLDRGHISAILFDNNEFRRAIADALNLTAIKYYGQELFPATAADDASKED